MNRLLLAAPAVTAICMSAPAFAEDYIIQPLQIGQEIARFNHGNAMIENTQGQGTIQVRPFITEHGNVAFGLAAFNASIMPANFGISNVLVSSNGQLISIMSVKQLIGKEKNRSMWKKLGIAVGTALGASAAANQRDTYYGSISTQAGRYGVSSSYSLSAPSIYGQRQAENISQQGYDAIAAVQSRLDQTQMDIGEASLELTTIDPGASGGGRIVLSKFKPSSYPQRVDMSIDWNGETYLFAFQIAREGTVQPHFVAFAMPNRQSPSMTAVRSQPAVAYQQQRIMGPSRLNFAGEPLQPQPTAAEVSSPARIIPRQGHSVPGTYADRLAKAQPIRGKNVKQGWTISD
ncbi:hypothetical protein [Sphingomonas sp. Leaf339]|uniref:hypothetical protein n=1 Tax=Sphingomonas sp. Leaf339 TaxID=1736343 RepID=UPI000B120D2B|nr:hypothetical protein [Sphingomonas sp. Leaf339]